MGKRGMDIERLPYRQASYGSFVQAMKNIAKFDYINKSRAQRAKRNETQRDALQKGETGGKTSNVLPLPPLCSSRRLCVVHAFVSPASAYFTPCGNAGKKFILRLPPSLGGGTK